MTGFVSDPLHFEVALILISVGAGMLGSILGLGGGVLIIPTLTLLFGIKRATRWGRALFR